MCRYHHHGLGLLCTSATLCLNLKLQILDNNVNEKYKTVESLIAKKTGESAAARKKAEALQNEAKTLLGHANSKLQLLRGKIPWSPPISTALL